VDPRQRKYIIILSILLHVLILLIFEGAAILNWLGGNTPPKAAVEETPIVFDLQQPQKPTQVVETPDDAKTVEKQDKANFLSDKNALARNEETKPDLKVDEAYARGDYKSHDLPVPQQPIGQTPLPKSPPIPEQKPQEKKEEPKEQQEPDPNSLQVENSGTAFIREFVMRKPNPHDPGVREQLPGIRHENLESRARDMGGLSFNTYNWEFAPYLLMLKKRIQRNIFPPAAFSQLGLISGESLIRFRIYPDGRLTDLQVLDYKGHESLMETSRKALQISAPFPALPKDFPEQFLEVTGKFMYIVQRR